MERSKAWMACSAVAMLIVSAAYVLAQMPGMEPPSKPEQPAARVAASARAEGTDPAPQGSAQAEDAADLMEALAQRSPGI